VSVLLDAFSRLERDAELWIAGDGPQRDVLRARGVPHVVWLGRVPDAEKAARLRGATIACFPAIDGESFGVVLLEAMAAGAAVVASDIDGYRDVARADAEALLVPPGDSDALARALRALLDDDDRRKELVAAGRARADEFSMDRLAGRFLDIYERAIAAVRAA
jgi:phosphatidylinositol alpha-mannosyltransferase